MPKFAHHDLIKSLIAQVRSLRREVWSYGLQLEDLEGAAYRAQERAEQAQREARRRADELYQAESDASYRNAQRQNAVRDLENARQWNDPYAVARALRKLKEL